MLVATSDCWKAATSALELGADEVVMPPHTPAVVLARAHLALARRANIVQQPREQLRLGKIVLDLKQRVLVGVSGPVSLTGREFELLLRLMDANGHPIRRGRLLREIWGHRQENEAVLDATVSRLRRKLGEGFLDSECLATIRGVGYRLAV